LLSKVRQRDVDFSVVKLAKLIEQVVHLILERELSEYADGVGISQALLEPREIERRLGRRCCRPRGGGRRLGRCRRWLR
jgi:hypothetical protein